MHLPEITLHSDVDVPGIVEHRILDCAELSSRNGFVEFPVQARACTPRMFTVAKQRLPKFSVYSLDDVILDGFRLFSKGGRSFTDYSLVSGEATIETARFNKKMSIGQTEDINFDNISIDPRHADTIARSGAILLPCSDEPSNFGSWIYRFIPKLLLSAQSADFAAVMVYQQPWMTDIIKFLGLKSELIYHDPRRRYRIERPLIPSLPLPEVLFRPEVMACMDRLHDQQDNTIDLGERLYVSRRAQSMKRPRSRALENETGLVSALIELGFKEFMPEHYSFAQQICIFDRARLIVGCGGSNMFGCVFARHAELVVDIESNSEWEHAHANLLSSIDSRWSMVQGEQTTRGLPPHGNWIIDVDSFVIGLRKLAGI